MSKTIKYLNKDTNVELSLNIDKKMIFIYGKNGTGKTTLSRSSDLDSRYVFNEDFIHKNVYIIESTGAKVDAEVKNNFSGLLIGEDVIKLKKEQVLYENLLKEVNDKKKELLNKIETDFKSRSIPVELNPLNSIVEDITYDFEQDLNKQISNFKSNYDLKQSIADNETLENVSNQIKQDGLVNILIGSINSIDLLKEYMLDDSCNIKNSLNMNIECINQNKTTITELEKIISNKKIDLSKVSIIKSVIQLQDESQQDTCILCGKENPKAGIEEWKKIIYDKYIELKQSMKDNLTNYLKRVEDILKDKEEYIKIVPKTVNNIEIFKETLEEVLKSLDKEDTKLIDFPQVEKDHLSSDLNEKMKSVATYLVKDVKNELVFYNSVIPYFEQIIMNKKSEIENLLQENAEKHTSSINEILNKLDLTKEIKVKIDRAGGQIKYTLQVNNGDISKLSDGQKHKLALAIFLNSIKGLDLTDKIVMFDDPVVAMDEYTYHLFKNYVIKEVMTQDEKCPTLIIATHNFSYFYIQISNIITNPQICEETKVLKLYSDRIREMDIELFKLDDLALFKKALNNIKYNQQLIIISSLFNKISREFLDLKIRIQGMPLNANPSDEIKKLNVSDSVKKELQELINTICDCSKNPNVILSDAKNALSCLLRFINLLGFSDYNQDIDEDYFQQLDNAEINYERDDIDIIIDEISEILRNNSHSVQYKNYINHPRISFTKNALATSLDI